MTLKINPMIILAPLFLLALPEDIMYNLTNRFTSADTLNVRLVNWELYNQHWADNLNLFKFLFGFGIDSSREAAFFLSAMHPDPSFQQPHIHNIYLEMFYNYGLIAILFFLPFVLVLAGNFKHILRNKYDIFHCLSICVVVFFFVFYLTESPSLPSIIVIFSLIGFVESIRRAINETKEENPVFN